MMGPRSAFDSKDRPVWRRNLRKPASAHLVWYADAMCRRRWSHTPEWSDPVELTRHGQPFGRVCDVCVAVLEVARRINGNA